jgi:hypothetical protein
MKKSDLLAAAGFPVALMLFLIVSGAFVRWTGGPDRTGDHHAVRTVGR